MDVQTRVMGPYRLACVRHVGPYNECEAAFKRLCAWAGPRGLMEGKAEVLGLSYDNPATVPAAQLRYDACLVVPEDVGGDDHVEIRIVPAAKYAVAMHRGEYATLGRTFDEVRAWVNRNSALGDGPCIERYLNSCADTAPADLLTEICMQLK